MNNFNEILESEIPVLVDFHATWCGPCKMMAPELNKLKGMMGEGIRILKIDVDQNPGTAGHYHVSGVPTLILFQKGKILWRQSGAMSAAQLSQIIRQHTGVGV
jgi:thioredoxin 1